MPKQTYSAISINIEQYRCNFSEKRGDILSSSSRERHFDPLISPILYTGDIKIDLNDMNFYIFLVEPTYLAIGINV